MTDDELTALAHSLHWLRRYAAGATTIDHGDLRGHVERALAEIDRRDGLIGEIDGIVAERDQLRVELEGQLDMFS